LFRFRAKQKHNPAPAPRPVRQAGCGLLGGAAAAGEWGFLGFAQPWRPGDWGYRPRTPGPSGHATPVCVFRCHIRQPHKTEGPWHTQLPGVASPRSDTTLVLFYEVRHRGVVAQAWYTLRTQMARSVSRPRGGVHSHTALISHLPAFPRRLAPSPSTLSHTTFVASVHVTTEGP
jgi:hypothetical protein